MEHRCNCVSLNILSLELSIAGLNCSIWRWCKNPPQDLYVYIQQIMHSKFNWGKKHYQCRSYIYMYMCNTYYTWHLSNHDMASRVNSNRSLKMLSMYKKVGEIQCVHLYMYMYTVHSSWFITTASSYGCAGIILVPHLTWVQRPILVPQLIWVWTKC